MRTAIDKLGKVAVTVEKDYWSNKKTYDKLTIVEKKGIFGTYISRKPVPTGIDLSDREYWIPFSSLRENLVSDYNHFIDRFTYLIDAHDAAIDDIQLLINSIVEHLPVGITVECDTKFLMYGQTKDVLLKCKVVNDADTVYWLVKGDGFENVETVDPDIEYVKARGYKANEVVFRIKNCQPTATIKVFCESVNDAYTYRSTWLIGCVYPSYLGFVNSNILNPTPLSPGMVAINKPDVDITGRYVRTCSAEKAYLYLISPRDVVVDYLRMNGFEIQMELSDRTINYNNIEYAVRKSVSKYSNLGDTAEYPIMINAYKEDRGDIIQDVLNTIANLPSPDEEDITYDNATNRYKFADKAYNANDYSGYGRKYLRKNRSYKYFPFDGFVNNVSVNKATYSGRPAGVYFDRNRGVFVAKAGVGSNNTTENDTGLILIPDVQITPIENYYLDWTYGRNIYTPINPITIYRLKGTDEYYRWNGGVLARYYGPIEATTSVLVQSMISEPNTIYIIQYDYDLLGQTINLPENCILKFEGGSLKNGVLVGTTCGIEGTPRFENISLQGSWNDRVYSGNRPANPYIGQSLLIDIGNKRINETKYVPAWWTGDAWIDANGNEV